MAETLQMWDRLAGELIVYVENYLLSSKSGLGFGLDPSYKVDYEIKDTILDYLEKPLNSGDINEIWQHRITTCKNVNDLPNKLQKLVNQFLPRFLSQHPEYKHEKSLVGKRRTHTFEGHADGNLPAMHETAINALKAVGIQAEDYAKKHLWTRGGCATVFRTRWTHEGKRYALEQISNTAFTKN